eukprot:gene11432-23911_t
MQSNTASYGGGLYMFNHNYDILISNNNIQSNDANSGGGCYMNSNNLNIKFNNNHFRSNIAVANFGGAIFISNTNYDIHLINNFLVNNTAKYSGGGYYIDLSNGNIHFSNETFISNKASFGGGLSIGSFNVDITLEKSLFYTNEANTGGAIHIDRFNRDITVHSSIFSNNTATSDNGGAVLINDYNSLINIGYSTFQGNRAIITGGAVCISSFNSELSFWRSSFIGNSAQDGGGLSLSIRAYNIQLKSIIFENNAADNNGGALFVNYKISTMIMTDVLIENNRAGSSGGGLFIGIQNDHISCERCIYHRNIAQGDGGGVYISQYNNELSFANCIVGSNSARSSGGGFHVNIRNEHVRMNSVLFTSNVANKGNGGALYVGEFNNNITVSNCNMTMNTAITGSGSGLFSYQTNSLQIVGSNFVSNVGSQMGTVTLSVSHANCVIRDCLFMNNTATSGSAISVVNSVNIVILNCQFYGNFANKIGGSMYIYGVNRVLLRNLQIRNNIAAAGDGGGIYIIQSSSVTLRDNYLYGNRASHQGGGIYLATSSVVSIKQCQFSNSNSEYGSAVYMSSTLNIYFHLCSFTKNIADAGGTVYWTSSDMIEPRGLNSSSSSMIWAGNRATYGSKYATGSHHFLSPSQIFIDRNSERFNSFLPAMKVIYYDYYDQIVQTENSDIVTVTLVDWKGGCTPFPLKGAQTAVVVNGTAVFDSLSTSCTPEGNLYLQFTSKTYESLSSETVVTFPTFSPTRSPTSTPTTVPVVVVVQQLTVTSDNSVTTSDSFIGGVSVGSSLLLILIVLAVTWRYMWSPKAVKKRERMKRLDNLPLHKLLVDYSPTHSNNEKMLHMLESHPEYALEKDYDNKTALDIIFEDENSLGVSSDVIYLLLLSSYQSNEIGEHSMDNHDNDNVNGHSAWLDAVQRNDESTVTAVERILVKFKRNIRSLAHAENIDFREDTVIYGLEEYPYCIVMEAATQDLKRFIDHEQIIDMNIEEIKPIMRQLTCCLEHIHKKNFVHGDLKPLNILQKGALLTLTDLDASCSIGNDVFAESKTSTGYLPPEMFWCDSQSEDEVK